MDDLKISIEDIKIDDSVFKDVKFYVSGHVQEKVLEILRLGGAERMNYFSDYVTHLVCGNEPDESDLTDASDVYEIPIVTVRWIITCAKLRKKISPKGFKYDPSQLFSGMVFCFSKIIDDKNALWSLITYHGGVVQHNLNVDCTHLITCNLKSGKYLKACSLNDKIRIITIDWVLESAKNKSLAQYELFHPKLLTWPKPRESTALITGFEQDDTEKVSDIPETESTQALLDQLKQRMPWNQPAPTTTSSSSFQNFLSPALDKRLPWAPASTSSSTNTTSTPYSFSSEAPAAKRLPWNQQNMANNPPPPFPTSSNSQPDMSPVKATVYSNMSESHAEQPVSSVATVVQQVSQQQHVFPQQRPQQIRTSQSFSTAQTSVSVQNTQQQVAFNQQNQITSIQSSITQQSTQIPPTRNFITQNQQHLVQNSNQAQYKLQIGQSQVQSHITAQQPGHVAQLNQQNINQNQQLIHGQPQLVQNQISQNRLTQQGQLPFSSQAQITGGQQQVQFSVQQQVQQSSPFGTRGTIAQEQISFSAQNQLQINQPGQNQLYGVQNQNQPPTSVQHQFIQQKVQQRPQLHANWQQQQLNQQLNQQQLNQQQLNQQQLNQQQLNQQQLNQQQLNQQQLNQQQLTQQQQPLNPQQLAQQLNQQQLNQQQLNQQQLNSQQLNQQQLNQQQLNQQQLNQQQLNQQQLNQQQLNQQQLNQLNQQQISQQQLNQQLNSQHISQQQLQPQQQIAQQQLNPQQIAQQQLNPQQIKQLQQRQLAQQQLNQQQLNQPHLVQQQINPQLNPQISQQQLNQQHLVQQQISQQQLGVQRHPNSIGAPRLNWSPNQPQGAMPQRQLIHLDAQTHHQLQQMDPQQRALFVAKLQKQRQQLIMQQRQQQLLQQQRGGHIAVIRGGMPPGLTPQQQMQWLQQQQQSGAKPQAIVMPQQHAPGLSPIAQAGQVLNEQQTQQIQRQQFQRLQHLQMQREQAQKQQQLQQQVPAGAIVRPPLAPQEAPAVAVAAPPAAGDQTAAAPPPQQLVVNAKTKTALANMLSIRLQSGSGNIPPVEGEPSAAGTLRLMTAQHNAALNQTPSRPQDLLTLQQQRRTLGNITNAAGDIPRAPTAPPAPAGGSQPPEPAKQQYSPGRVLAPHRPGPFYGHNPNLKLPPDLFLLGCIFVVVEVERYLEETSPDWRTVIERHGGEIEPMYCSRVTHVLCETQRHGVVMQALRDFKRCVTLFWLDDVVKRKQVVPPWQALHLPTGYMDGAPASRHLISLSGFSGADRSRVREMIKYTGAKFTSYFSRHNTVLVCAKAEGVKYQHAKRWGTPIVNVQWLTDLMLGNFSALNQIEHVKYQQFAQPVQFGFDTALVPNLMFAWKMPINISQESYERVKRSPSPVVLPPKPKKPRLDPPLMSENEISSKEISQTHRILFSLYNDKDRTNLEKIVSQLGGSVARTVEDATHLVMPHLARSIKLLLAIVSGIHIVPDSWLKESAAESKFLEESTFKFDTKDFNATFNCDFYKTLETKNRDKLFQNKVFYLTPSVFPSSQALKEIIEKAGGVVEKQRRNLQQIEAANSTVPYSYIILTNENDLHLVYDCLRSSKGDKLKYVSSSEVVMMAILTQNISVESYLVKVY